MIVSVSKKIFVIGSMSLCIILLLFSPEDWNPKEFVSPAIFAEPQWFGITIVGTVKLLIYSKQ